MINIAPAEYKQITDMFNRRRKAIGLSGYTAGEMIGHGGSACVYRLAGRSGKPDYVLRISEEQTSPYSNDVYNLRELNILQEMRRISQPHVVQYIDAFIVDIPGSPRYYCSVMKRLIPLNKYRMEGDGAEIAVRLGSDLLPLLQSFADKEIIHRDIKPENIFYDGSFRNQSGFLLGDFGIAKHDTESLITPNGTESTVSPEVRGLDRSLGKDRSRSDMYSLGIVMYRYLNEGVYPSNHRRVDRVPPDKNPFPEPRYGSKRLKALVLKATGYDPDDRFESPQDMLRELQQCEEYGQYIGEMSMGSQPTVIPQPGSPAPYIRHSAPEVKPVVRQPVKKSAACSLVKNKPLLISCASSAAVLLLIVLLIVLFNSDTMEINGEKYHKNSQKSLYFTDATVTAQDCAKIAQFKALDSLRFEGCRFESGAFRELSGIDSSIETLTVSGCTGIGDYSALSSMGSLKYLTVSDSLLTDKLLSAASFDGYTGLHSLDLSNNAELSDISCLKPVAGTLAQVNLSGTAVKDFSVLGGGSLKELNAENAALNDGSLLKLPAGLQKLYLGHNRITDISPLKNYGELTGLDLSYNKITDVSPLSGCAGLNYLSLAHNSIADITALSACPELKEVNVSYNKLNGLEGLEQAIYLSDIRAAHNKLTSIDGLANCTLLQYVDLSANKLSDISLLSKSAEKLNTVLLDKNRLKDIATLKNTTGLQYISLDRNELKSLSPLKQSTALKAISASGNAIGSVQPICGAKELGYVYLSNNMINTLPDEFCYLQKLHEVDLSFNYITTGDFIYRSYSEFNLLALHVNPISELKKTSGHKGSRLTVTYHESMDFSAINNSFYYYDIVGCPLDRQVEIHDTLNGTVSYITSEEASEGVSKYFRLCPEE